MTGPLGGFIEIFRNLRARKRAERRAREVRDRMGGMPTRSRGGLRDE